MLALKRKKGEEITIGDNIRVRIIETNKRFVRIGIEAPREILVLRAELACKNQNERLVDGSMRCSPE